MVTPLAHQVVLDAVLHDLADLGELLAAVDADDVLGGDRGDGHGLEAAGDHDVQGVGQVVFALDVVGLDVVQGVEQVLGAEAVVARVDFPDLLLLGGAVALLDDALEVAVAVADDAAVAGGVR